MKPNNYLVNVAILMQKYKIKKKRELSYFLKILRIQHQFAFFLIKCFLWNPNPTWNLGLMAPSLTLTKLVAEGYWVLAGWPYYCPSYYLGYYT